MTTTSPQIMDLDIARAVVAVRTAKVQQARRDHERRPTRVTLAWLGLQEAILESVQADLAAAEAWSADQQE